MSDRNRLSSLLIVGISATASFLWLWSVWEFYAQTRQVEEEGETASYNVAEELAITKSTPGQEEDAPTTANDEDFASLIATLWEKIVSATRDTSQHENLMKINFDQWNLALDRDGVVCEPGLSRTIFRSMSRSGSKKQVLREEFCETTQHILADTMTYEQHAHLKPKEVLEISRRDDSELLARVLLTKILFALFNNETLNVESLLKETFEITDDMTSDDLLARLNEADWEIRVQILKHLQNNLKNGRLNLAVGSDSDDSVSSAGSSGEISPMTLLEGWMEQFADQRSQLVRHALLTFPDVIECLLRNGYGDAIELRAVFEALFVPIRAKRSTKIQEWAHICCENVVGVMLDAFGNAQDFNRFEDMEEDVDEKSVFIASPTPSASPFISSPFEMGDHSSGYLPVMELVDIFCSNVTKNDKYERVRERCVSYLTQVIEFHRTKGDIELLLKDEMIGNGIVGALNLALLDKKSDVRSKAFELMKKLSDMGSAARECVLNNIDEKARDRFDRSTKSATKKKRRSVRRRGQTVADFRNKTRRQSHARVSSAPHN